MDKSMKKTRNIGIVIIIAIAVASWFFLLGPRFSEPGTLEEQATAAMINSESLVGQVKILQEQEKALPQAEELASTLERKFPSTTSLPSLIEQIQNAAAQARMAPSQIISIIPSKPIIPESAKGAAPAPEAAPAAPAEGETAPAAPAPAAPASAGAGASYAFMEVTISSQGTFTDLAQFIVQLQRMDRVLVIDNVTISAIVTPASTDPNTNPTLDPNDPNAVLTANTPQYQMNITGHTVLLPPVPKLNGENSTTTPTNPSVPTPAPSSSSLLPVTPSTPASPSASPTPSSSPTQNPLQGGQTTVVPSTQPSPSAVIPSGEATQIIIPAPSQPAMPVPSSPQTVAPQQPAPVSPQTVASQQPAVPQQ